MPGDKMYVILANLVFSGVVPQSKLNLVYFSLKIRHLVATILMIFTESTNQISCTLKF